MTTTAVHRDSAGGLAWRVVGGAGCGAAATLVMTWVMLARRFATVPWGFLYGVLVPRVLPAAPAVSGRKIS